MESNEIKILLYKKRTCGENFNATFGFIKVMIKPLLKYLIYFMLPVCLVEAFFLNNIAVKSVALSSSMVMTGGRYDTGSLISVFVNFGLYYLVYIIGYAILVSLVYGLMKAYATTDDLKTITFDTIKDTYIRDLKRTLLLILVGFGLEILCGIVMIALACVTPFTLILTLPALLIVAIPPALWIPTYLFDKDSPSVLKAFTKSFHLGWKTWGVIFGLTFLTGIIAVLVQIIPSIPWRICSGMASEYSSSHIFPFIMYLTAVIECMGIFLGITIQMVALAYQYGTASEIVENTSINDDINKFDNLQ